MANDTWETPDDLFEVLDKEFKFGLDAACTKENCKLKKYDLGLYKEEIDSLSVEWREYMDPACNSVWLNPPYSRGNIEKFMEKAYKESLKGCTVVCLVRFDPSTKWLQEWVHDKAEEVRMMKRRVKFVGADSCYPFPTCIVVYTPHIRNGIVLKGHIRGEHRENTNYTLWDWK